MASLQAFMASLAEKTNPKDYAFAAGVKAHIPIYDAVQINQMGSADKQALRQEWAQCWQHQAGVMVVRGLIPEATVDAVTEVFMRLLKEQHKEHNLGDHFAPMGANGRVWNALEKLAVAAPQAFIDYYKNPVLADICQAWLGPDYRLTSQVNLVYPGGTAQQPHRDYHLGFTTPDELAAYPLHVQTMSAMLTLQGAVAHGHMPVASGPTMLLPYSQRYAHGYGLYQQEDFMSFFAEHAVQLPLQKGDGVFFSPALMHAAGANSTSDIERMANLLQVSSPFGKAMENVDTNRMQLATYETLQAQQLGDGELAAVSTALSDNYPFPTNMDRDAPAQSLKPLSGKDILLQALQDKATKQQLHEALQAQKWRQKTR